MGESIKPNQRDIERNNNAVAEQAQNALRIFRDHIIEERNIDRERNFLQGELGQKFKSAERALEIAEQSESEDDIARYLAIAEVVGMDLKQTLAGLSIACRNTARAKREQAVEYEENSRDYNNIMGEAEELEEMATEADNFCNQLSS